MLGGRDSLVNFFFWDIYHYPLKKAYILKDKFVIEKYSTYHIEKYSTKPSN